MTSFQKKISQAILARIRAQRKGSSAVGPDRSNERLTLGSPSLRQASFSDFGRVAELKERLGLAPDSFANWERLWRHNPALGLGNVDRPIGWVLEFDRKIVGYLGNISLRCYFGGHQLSAVAAHAFLVEQPYRALALSLAGAFYAQKV